MSQPFSMNQLTLSLAALAASCALSLSAQPSRAQGAPPANQACPGDNTGLKLPGGFCASIFADRIGHARHLVVTDEGVVYANTWSGRYYGNDKPHDGGFLVALQDTTGSGKADVVQRFGETVESGGHGGTGIALYKGSLYAETNDKIVKYHLTANMVAPQGKPETVVAGLPLTGDHPMHPLAIDASGNLFVDLGTATNSCQDKNRTLGSPGISPCTELETRGGVWRFDAAKTNQEFSPKERYATGIRNAEGYAVDVAGHRVFVTQHGRDQLHTNFPNVIKEADKEATLPAEELMLLKKDGDYGWPFCYYDPFQKKLVLAPEYGGDGRKVGECAGKIEPVAVFPAHWAPNAAVFYDKQQFPARYRNGVFIAFHGSWNRAPYAQSGYNVVYQSMSGAAAGKSCEIFADGFAGPNLSPSNADHRPTGLAVGPDGALYVADDTKGRIYKITYRGGTAEPGNPVACPSPSMPAGSIAAANAQPPEGTHPDAGAALSVPPGSSRAAVTRGANVFNGQTGATCAGCHGPNGEGSPLGPDLTKGQWMWSDGSLDGITATITKGVSQPKQYRQAMPPMGGSQLSGDDLQAVAAYVWAIGHRAAGTASKPK